MARCMAQLWRGGMAFACVVLAVAIMILSVPALGRVRAGTTKEEPRPAPNGISVAPAEAFVPGVVLVQVEPAHDEPRRTQAVVTALAEVHSIDPLDAIADTYRVAVEPGRELAVAAQLASNPAVRVAEPDYLFHKMTSPSDSLYYRQWNLRHIRAHQGWVRTTGSSNVVIAVVDTGVDLTHPDLAGKIVPGIDTAHNDADPSDDDGHGTHVASIAAANSNNGEGIAGIAWGARIMPIKVLDANGSGSSSNLARGIIWAVDHGADIINLSLGGSKSSTLVADAITYAYERGVLVVAAAGNHYAAGNPTTYPAAYNHVLAVAATDDADGHASYSTSGSYVDVAAPGGDPSGPADTNEQHWIPGAYWRGSGVSYAWLSGTSQAAPHVAGLAALLLSLTPSLTPDQLQTIITGTAVDVQAPGWDEFSGHGRIDVLAAIDAVQPPPPPTPTSTPTATATATPGATPTPTAPARPRADLRINSSTAHQQTDAAIAGNAMGAIISIWRDGRSGSDAIYSADLPATEIYWGPNIRVAGTQERSTDGSMGAPFVAIDPNGSAYAIWHESAESVDPRIYVSVSATDPLTWSVPVQIYDDPLVPVSQTHPALAVAGDGTLIAVWEEQRSSEGTGNSVVTWSEQRAGSNGWLQPLPIQPGSTSSQEAPTIVAHGDKMYAGWISRGEKTTDLIVAQRALSSGTWATATVASVPLAAEMHAPDLAVDPSGNVVVVWSDRHAEATGFDVYAAYWIPGSSTWSLPVRINDDRGNRDQKRPQVAAGTKEFVVVWEDDRLGDTDIFIAWQSKAGARWWPSRRVNQDGPGTLQFGPAVAMDAHGNTTVVWTDHRTGSTAPEVYSRFIAAQDRFPLYLPLMSKH